MTGVVVPMPGTVEYRSLSGYRWLCPLRRCYSHGRWVRKQATAMRGLILHAQQVHGVVDGRPWPR